MDTQPHFALLGMVREGDAVVFSQTLSDFVCVGGPRFQIEGAINFFIRWLVEFRARRNHMRDVFAANRREKSSENHMTADQILPLGALRNLAKKSQARQAEVSGGHPVSKFGYALRICLGNASPRVVEFNAVESEGRDLVAVRPEGLNRIGRGTQLRQRPFASRRHDSGGKRLRVRGPKRCPPPAAPIRNCLRFMRSRSFQRQR